MKIVKVEIFLCELKRRDATAPLRPILLRVHTDEKVSGIGEAGLAYGAAGNAAVGILKDLAQVVLGQDPMRVEALWELMFRGTVWGAGGGPIFYAGMSAYDIAMWDIRGKALNAPIYQLLGGKTRDALRCYASQLQFGWDKVYHTCIEPEEYAEQARKAVADGFDAVKVDPIMYARDGRSLTKEGVSTRYYHLRKNELELGRKRLAAVRDAVGPDVDIILEMHSLLGTNSAIQFGKAIQDLDLIYYEEPVHPMHSDNFAKVAREAGVPLATGERSYTRWGYRDLLEKQALSVIQPDLCLCGGITEAKKISDYGHMYDVAVQPHVCGSPVAVAATLQLEAVLPNFLLHEFHSHPLKDCFRELCTNDWLPEKGQYKVPDLPGLGQELNDEIVQDYLVCTIE